MREIIICVLAVFISFTTFCQTTIVSQGFENSNQDTWQYTATPAAYIEQNSTDVWSPIDNMIEIKNAQQGAFYWGIRDLQNSGSGGDFDHILQFEEVNIADKSDVLVSFYYNAVNLGTWDYIKVEFFFDSVSQGLEELQKSTDGWKEFSKTIPEGTEKIRFNFIARQNGSTEYVGLDALKLQSGADVSPKLTVDSPTNGDTIYVNSAGVTVSFTTTNFVMSEDNGAGQSDNSGDGYLNYRLDNGPWHKHFGNQPIPITGFADGDHILALKLVTNAGSALNPSVTKIYYFTTVSAVQSLPLSESFDYPVGETLDEQQIWFSEDTTTDNVIINSGNLTYPGLAFASGNSISFDQSGTDPFMEFEKVTSGQVYCSFIINVKNIAALNEDRGGYFVLLRNGQAFVTRVWLKKESFDMFSIGMSNGPTGTFSSEKFTINTSIFLVIGYNLTTGTSELWINPDPTRPATRSTLSQTSTPAASIDNFLIRQFSASDTPFIVLDELKIGKSWGDVTNIPLDITEIDTQKNNPIITKNPISEGLLHFSKKSEGLELEIFDILGNRALYFSTLSATISVSQLPSGVYLAQFYKNSKIVGSEKIIVNQ